MTSKGTPTYETTDYVIINGLAAAGKMCGMLVTASVFFVLEPMPDDLWYFYVKEEAAEIADTLAYVANTGGQPPL
jgi:hypothetical protein